MAILSIITITFHNPIELERTLQSVRPHYVPSRTELIVIDGSVDDSCKEVVQSYTFIDRIIHESDKGRFDAMNKGTRIAGGDFLLYLNSGDELLADFDMDEALRRMDDITQPRVFYGDVVIDVGGSRFLKRTPVSMNNIPHLTKRGKLPSHQATLYPASFAKNCLYDLSYHISADTKYFLAAISRLPATHLRQPISVFYLGGVSNVYRNIRQVFEHLRQVAKARNYSSLWLLHSLPRNIIKFIAMRLIGWTRYYRIYYSLRPTRYQQVRDY